MSKMGVEPFTLERVAEPGPLTDRLHGDGGLRVEVVHEHIELFRIGLIPPGLRLPTFLVGEVGDEEPLVQIHAHILF